MAPFLCLFPELSKEKNTRAETWKVDPTVYAQYILKIMDKSRINEEQNIASAYNNKIKLEWIDL